MNMITDKAQWFDFVKDEQTIAEWRKEAFLSHALMSHKAWDWCVAELRVKAEIFKKKRVLRVLDTGSGVCKSDHLVPKTLINSIKSNVSRIRAEKASEIAKRMTKEQVVDVVDPYMYPLVYGDSRVMTDGRTVTDYELLTSTPSRDNTNQIPSQSDERIHSAETQEALSEGRTRYWSRESNDFQDYVPEYYWSFNFQCLPCEADFTDDGGDQVTIASYINNLRYESHRLLYDDLSNIISLSIQPWDECLIRVSRGPRGQVGSTPMRIVAFGGQWVDSIPDQAKAFRKLEKRRRLAAEMGDDIIQNEDGSELTPDWKMAQEYLELPERGSSVPVVLAPDWKNNVWHQLWIKSKKQQRVQHPEPGGRVLLSRRVLI